MTVFTKDPRAPETLAYLKENGEILLEVTSKQLYIMHNETTASLEELMREWFIKYKGRSHAYRDGSRMGGSEDVIEIRNLSNGGKLIPLS